MVRRLRAERAGVVWGNSLATPLFLFFRRGQVQGDADLQQNQTSAKLAFVSVWFWLRLWFTFLFCQSSARFSDRLLIVLLIFLLIVFWWPLVPPIALSWFGRRLQAVDQGGADQDAERRPMNKWCPSFLSVTHARLVQRGHQRVATDVLRGVAQAREAYESPSR